MAKTWINLNDADMVSNACKDNATAWKWKEAKLLLSRNHWTLHV